MRYVFAICSVALVAAACAAPAAPPGAVPVRLLGDLERDGDLSGIAMVGEYLYVVSDEDASIHVLRRTDAVGSMDFREVSSIALNDSGEEIDLEGLAATGSHLFAIGSHSRVRHRERLTVRERPARDRLCRLELDPSNGDPSGAPTCIDLRPILAGDELLGPFTQIPGKENGVDIEGIAVDAGRIYLGLRSPVLRDGHVPILVLPLDGPGRHELRFVKLGGLGVRDMARAGGGFLLIAGPAGEGDGPFELWLWDGSQRLARVGALPRHASGARPEGLAVLAHDDESYRVLVVHDGVAGGDPTVLTFSVPGT